MAKAFCIFLSRVNSEFGAFDGLISESISGHRPAIKVSSQSTFGDRQAGNTTLHKLLNELRHVTVVVHYLGQALGLPVGTETAELLRTEPRLQQWLEAKGLDYRDWSYTQWEAYLAIYLSQCERVYDDPVLLICYWVGADNPASSVQQHWHALELFYGKHPRRLNALGSGPDRNLLLCMQLSLAILNSDVCFPPPVLRVPAQWIARCNSDLRLLLDAGHLLIQDIVALAFVLDPAVLDLEGSIRQQRQFLARLVDYLATEVAPVQVPRICTLLAALAQLLKHRGQPTAMLNALLDDAVLQLGRGAASVDNAFSIAYPDCFPVFPLRLCVEAFVQMISAEDFHIRLSYRVGTARLFIEETAAVDGLMRVRDPRHVLNVARALTADISARHGGAHRIELILAPAFFESDEFWKKAACTPWEEGVGHVFEEDECAVVLRWPHTDSTAAKLRPVRPDSMLRIAADPVCEGMSVFREPIRGVCHEPLRMAMARSTLIVWRRGEQALPTDALELRWDEVPMAFHGQAWKHVGIALNPPEAPVYPLPCFSVKSLAIQMRLE